MHIPCARVPSVVMHDDEVEVSLLGVADAFSSVAQGCRGFRARRRALHGSSRREMRRVILILCSSYLTRFRRASRVSGAQHLFGQRLIARQPLFARTLIYDRHNGRCELSPGRSELLQIWHSSHVFTTRFSLL